MQIVTYSVPNISCGHCVHTIQTELIELEGVKDVRASAETKTVVVHFERPPTRPKSRRCWQKSITPPPVSRT